MQHRGGGCAAAKPQADVPPCTTTTHSSVFFASFTIAMAWSRYFDGRGLMELPRTLLAVAGRFPGADYEDLCAALDTIFPCFAPSTCGCCRLTVWLAGLLVNCVVALCSRYPVAFEDGQFKTDEFKAARDSGEGCCFLPALPASITQPPHHLRRLADRPTGLPRQASTVPGISRGCRCALPTG